MSNVVFLRGIGVFDTTCYMSLTRAFEIAGQHGLTHMATPAKVALPQDSVACVILETRAS